MVCTMQIPLGGGRLSRLTDTRGFIDRSWSQRIDIPPLWPIMPPGCRKKVARTATDEVYSAGMIAPLISQRGTSIGAAGLILRRTSAHHENWLLLRARKHGEWGFPKGHQDVGESTLETALRECAEECGIGLLAIEGNPLEAAYLLPNGRTKTVVYFPAITSQRHVELSAEHVAHAWMSANQVLQCLPHANMVLLFRSYLHQLSR
jgi:8-oxo-dGTP pyrophosphatase MutT (NUDIX family)